MGSVWLSLRADIRLRGRPVAALALLLGLIGGVVLTAAAGARRTDTAYPRLLQWAGATQVSLIPEGSGMRYITPEASLTRDITHEGSKRGPAWTIAGSYYAA